MLDIRIQNTKSRIQNGLLELLKQKPLNDITTKDIIESAEASRKTFYTYYKDKRDLLMEIEGAIITDLQEALKEDRKCLTQHSSFPDKEEIFRLSQESFAHTVQVCSDYREVSRILLSPNGDINLLTRITYSEFMHRGKLLFYFNSQHPSTNVHPSPIPVDYLFEIYTGTLTNIIVHWVRSDDRISTSALREIMGYAQTHSPVELIYLTNFDEQADPDQPSTTSTPNRKKSGQSPLPLLKHMGFGCWPLFWKRARKHVLLRTWWIAFFCAFRAHDRTVM